MNEKRMHLMNCPLAHMDAEHVAAASQESVELVYALHMEIRHGACMDVSAIVREISPGL